MSNETKYTKSTCKECNGAGGKSYSQNVFQDGLGYYEWQDMYEQCTPCDGNGYILTEVKENEKTS